MKRISLVIPVYNGVIYLATCLESVFAQEGFDLSDLEIILIDDGSSDDSFLLIKKYKEQYPDVVVAIQQENRGAAKTRNRGIQLAKGEFVTLLDQDDTIEKDYLKTYYEAAIVGNYDVVQGGFKLINTEGDTKGITYPIGTMFGRFLHIPAWGKLYSTKFLLENKITFLDNNIGEDSTFTTEVIIKSNTYKQIHYAGYRNFFDNANNVTNTFHKGLSKKIDIIRLLDSLETILDNANAIQHPILTYNILRTAAYYLLSYGKYATRERFVEEFNKIFEWLGVSIKGSGLNKYTFFPPRGEKLTAWIGVVVLVFINKTGLVEVFAGLYCKGK